MQDFAPELLEMIETVSQCSDERAAASALLLPLLRLFQMDQAAICTLENDTIHTQFAMDRSRKLLPTTEPLWLSRTLVRQALASLEPAAHTTELELSDGIPKSISDQELKSVICIPVSRTPARFVYLASRRNPGRQFSNEELAQLKTATRAAILALGQHHALSELKTTNQSLRNALASRKSELVYASGEMKSLAAEVARLAPFNICILIQGESGTGKEVMAREIHQLSGRKGRFIAVNCANLTETLLESELFGYTRGAFTGATAQKIGLIQEAEGGTFLLDEIAELPMPLQAKLLRVLQEKTVRPIGSNHDIPIDVRFLAASHKGLDAAVASKTFREDLYYRIQEMTIHVPPLRQRMEDIELLAHHFVHEFSTEFKLPIRSLSRGALDLLLKHSWPGNARELRNVARTAVILSRSTEIQASELRIMPPPSVQQPPAGASVGAFDTYDGKSLRELTQSFERSLIEKMLSEQGQTQASVAQRLNLSTRTIQRILNGAPAAP